MNECLLLFEFRLSNFDMSCCMQIAVQHLQVRLLMSEKMPKHAGGTETIRSALRMGLNLFVGLGSLALGIIPGPLPRQPFLSKKQMVNYLWH